MSASLILYACPLGDLSHQLDQYFVASREACGPNAAHAYMPHCTLTGFFRDQESAIERYEQAIAAALNQQWAIAPQPDICITGMTFRSDWHGLELQSNWLQQFVARFVQLSVSPTRTERLRPKSWLHLSLAYEFLPQHSQTLIQLAQSCINPKSTVAWELRFYQRYSDYRWTCHQSWSLTEKQL